MIERRDRVIDEGIERLASAFRSADPDPAAEHADRLIRDVAEVTAADDDIALLVMRVLDLPAGPEIERPGDLAALAEAPDAERPPGRRGRCLIRARCGNEQT